MTPSDKRNRWIKIGAITLGAAALLVTTLSMLTADLPIPRPTGPHAVGFAEMVVLDPSRTFQNLPARPISLDIWYPASSVQGFQAEPYSSKALNAEIAKSLGLPPFLGAITPSYSFRDAPALEGKHPVIIFNHGFGSFTRQNFSNFQELASQGHLVISIGHPGDSLMARMPDGKAILLDKQNPAYLGVTAQQKDLQNFLSNNARLLEQQRKASDFRAYQQISQDMAHIAPFEQLSGQIDAWIEDTAFVVQSLSHPTGILTHADPQNIVLMGHSLGGLVAQHFAQYPLAGIRGIINLDAPFVQRSATWTDLQLPTLNLLSTQYTFKGHNIAVAGTLDPLLKHSSAGSYVVEIPGTAHYNFSDMNYLQALRFTPMLGKIQGLKMERHLNQAVLAFLQRLQQPETLGQPLLKNPEIKESFFSARRTND
ncbi:alpha/beta hydrolase [Deinococcus roseus]|uniref:Carboxylic ester hydrolase n=1 Tax=Deinococcus roseus TaxID=392414 RepID=A0ABQ2CXA6_9DEIO|nr:alpha/beta fold hydrolase [Deinococcus roseus]GGJ26150.1 carboxylic ester hydrolase [Deinococcus roseus]